MKNQLDQEWLENLSETIRSMIEEGRIEQSEALVSQAMMDYPSAAQPHNLFGILLELKGDHAGAMKHFRAAWALDPSYAPPRKNLDHYGNFRNTFAPVFDKRDCEENQRKARHRKTSLKNGMAAL